MSQRPIGWYVRTATVGSELERGLVVPGLHALDKLATALNVTVADLVLGTTQREQESP